MGFRPPHGEPSLLLLPSLRPFLCLCPPLIIYRYLAVGTDRKCFIELATPKLTQKQMEAIETRCNECIRQRIPMTPKWFDADSAELKQVTTVLRK